MNMLHVPTPKEHMTPAEVAALLYEAFRPYFGRTLRGDTALGAYERLNGISLSTEKGPS